MAESNVSHWVWRVDEAMDGIPKAGESQNQRKNTETI